MVCTFSCFRCNLGCPKHPWLHNNSLNQTRPRFLLHGSQMQVALIYSEARIRARRLAQKGSTAARFTPQKEPGCSAMNELQSVLSKYSEANGYPIECFAIHCCAECGERRCELEFDEEQGVASTHCSSCQHVTWIADSLEYKDEVEEWTHAHCVCGAASFEVTVGVAFYQDDSKTARWLYIGAVCSFCNHAGIYTDWKCALENPARYFKLTPLQ